ncbi:CaiB/BaiF CoA transferase family protein [Acidicapsa ligni]|uniref:CaiB/BaiF CoA transferase family protein n=1 Tax=Acidicapsa ligni TaxID=542300 RepID=UPI0021E06ECE|nr:CaiB/BaiF CoA-transferase family protein [Acidicapsa ligni]
MKPLEGLLVIDLSQFLSGPSASLRLADLGARVVKIERPDTGDLCRHLYISNLELDGDSTLFHSINRNKESFVADLKEAAGLASVLGLIEKSDVVLHNFRPGVIEKLGLDYESLSIHHPKLIYGEISGYGRTGPWSKKPGQDLLVQSLSGLAWLNGDADQPPVPFGLAIADLYAGAHLCQGILACLVRRGITGKGGKVEVSLLESTLDFQFEVLTTFLNDGGKLPQRSHHNNAHAYLGAPYGIYATEDGYLALAMGSLTTLSTLLELPALLSYSGPKDAFDQRDEIKALLTEHLRQHTTEYWLARLEPNDYWCADVFTWPTLMDHPAFQALDMLQTVGRSEAVTMTTTRCPIRIDGGVLKSSRGAPRLGADTDALRKEFGLS